MAFDVIGHTFQRKALQTLVESGKLPSTMMLAGVPGIGKALVARELARTLLCERKSGPVTYGGCGTCHACHVFDAGNHPDFHFIQAAEKDRWGVEQVRELLFSLHLSSFSSGARVVMFDSAEQLSLAISNTLLKILEEPPARTYFILIVTNPSKLPPTLLSRCQIWFFDALKSDELRAVLARRMTLNANATADLALIADGSLDGIDHIEQHLEQWQDLTEKLDAIADGSRSQAALLAAELGRAKDSLHSALKLMRIYARNQMVTAAHEGGARREKAARWALFVANLLSAEYFLFERNLAPTPTLTVILDALTGQSDASFTCFTNSATLLSDIAV